MLRGQAKTDYQREYMRLRRRAGLATAKPPWRPPRRLVVMVQYWTRQAPWRLGQPAPAIIDGRDLTTDEGVFAACRRYQAHLAARRAARKREAEAREAADGRERATETAGFSNRARWLR